MQYIVFDLEFNQDYYMDRVNDTDNALPKYLHEIIQIGSIKLDENLQTTGTFNRYVKPTFLPVLNPFVIELTGITADCLESEEGFDEVYKAFTDFIGHEETVFCVWGMTDMKELFRNISYHRLDPAPLPRRYINLQPYFSKYLKRSSKDQLGLEYAVEVLGIEKTQSFHDALHDAFYTAEVFKRIHNPSMMPESYDPTANRRVRMTLTKREVDYEALIRQFEKMYARELSQEEIGMIRLAYKMGRTGQFVKED